VLIDDDIKINYSQLKDTPTISDTYKKDLLSHSCVYNTSNLDEYRKVLAYITQLIVDDFEGFRSPSRKLIKTTLATGTTNTIYAMREVLTTLERTTNIENLVFAMEIYTNNIQIGETGTFYFGVQASAIDEMGADSFASSEVLTLENGIAKTVYYVVPRNQINSFKYALFGIKAKNLINNVDIYTSWEYVGYNTSINEIVSNPLSYGDYKMLSDKINTTDYSHLKYLLINALCIGDSITKGAYYSPDSNGVSIVESYPHYLSKLTGWTTINAGVSGIDSINWYSNESTKYTYANYDTFIINLGTNGGFTDTLISDTATTSYTNYANTNTGSYCKIIEKILEQNPKAFIFLMNVTSTSGDSEITNSVVIQISQKYNLPIVDLWDFKGDPIIHPFSNNVHYGKVGNVKLANRVLETITEDINANPAKYEVILLP